MFSPAVVAAGEREEKARQRSTRLIETHRSRSDDSSAVVADIDRSSSKTRRSENESRVTAERRATERRVRIERGVATESDANDESVTVTRTQTRCRSMLERTMLSREYARARRCEMMHFQDLRARLFGLARTFDSEHRRTVCDLVRTHTVEYLVSLYDMSHRSFRFFDDACARACSSVPLVLATIASRRRDDALSLETETWLIRRTVENFARVHFYRIYENVRCYELRRIAVLEVFDRDDYAEYVIDLFLRQNEALARERRIVGSRSWTTATTRSTTLYRSGVAEMLIWAIDLVARIAHCSRLAKRSRHLDDDQRTPTITPTHDNDTADSFRGCDVVVSSLDLLVAAALHQRLGFNDRCVTPATIVERALSSPNWPSWNLPLSRYAASTAKESFVGSVDETTTATTAAIDVAATAANDVADASVDWTKFSAESYDYMLCYRQNARYDRCSIRGDADYYIGIFCTLFDVLK